MTPVILASQSAARASLLRGAGVVFTAASSGVDEDIAKEDLLGRGAFPVEIATALAEAKALAVARTTDGVVIGADQTLDFNGRLMDKAPTIEAARERLKALRGHSHRLHSAVVAAKGEAIVWRDLASATLHVRKFSDAWLEGYLERQGEAILSSVGCYQLEGEGVQLFDRIEGDYFAILGLPLAGLLEFLRREGALAS
jgi:septum formation protein